MGYVELARAELGEDSPAQIHVEQALKAVEHGAAMTNRLLSLSRCGEPEPRELDVNEIVLDVGSMLRRLIGGQIRLETELDPLLPRISADPNQLRRLLVNLAVNARDAMPHGGVLTIGTRFARHQELVEISVRDTGLGMDDAVRERAFEPFFTTKPEGEGTGLGLATVHGIVTQSGGSIAVDSTPGQGTTFSIGLPAAAAA
jgi:two-component system, cell cycle sensor histidine kinase and response regulator CckA